MVSIKNSNELTTILKDISERQTRIQDVLDGKVWSLGFVDEDILAILAYLKQLVEILLEEQNNGT